MRRRPREGQTRAIILTTQRTGSTFLVGCLDSHPDIHCITELLVGAHLEPPAIFRSSRVMTKASRFLLSGGWYPARAMERFYAGSPAPVSIFKIMYNQISNPPTLAYLTGDKSLCVLHLSRRNLLKAYVSRLLMPRKRNAIWEPHTTEPLPPVQTRVDPAQALAYMREARARYEHFEAAFAGHRRLPLAYEDLVDGRQLQATAGRRICDFFGLEYHPMQSRFIKLNPESLEAMVTNYVELAEAISETEFSGMLS